MNVFLPNKNYVCFVPWFHVLLALQKNILFFPCKYKFLDNWKLDFHLEINLEYAMCYPIIKTLFDSTFESDESIYWLKNVVFWGYGISYGIPYFHMLSPKCTYPLNSYYRWIMWRKNVSAL